MAHDQDVMGSNPGTLYWVDVSNDGRFNIKKVNIKIAEYIGTQKNHLKMINDLLICCALYLYYV
jgi:hypothetical protein